MDDITCEQLTINCEDGTVLAASYFAPKIAASAAVMIAPATGIKRQFYANFSRYLAQQGLAVLSFDNRGIGGSLQGAVSNSTASIQQWGEQDMPAVLAKLQQLVPNRSCHLIGHSAGGQLLGLMHNSAQLSSMFAFACSSGNLSNMRMPFWLSAQYFMNGFIPLSNLLFGHTKSQWFGMGEPLPKAVAQQWRHWCNGSGYVQTDFGHAIQQHSYHRLNIPALWINASDDEIANNRNVAEMIAVHHQLQPQRLTLVPQEHGLKEIGHMKFFSRQCQALWPLALDWIQQHSQPQQQAS
ncbi:alpha/beta fold hydrolase [uncultured Ferrimonas sp.]|uniref:alpha/beta hydrolase family protein n=1 Tax=uncultured Ferrimonas sp. TaxID=432640 RepID=UPI0026026242|nr:alpha/beta fold hydrolase [uncultured Ferrimonas sp.]